MTKDPRDTPAEEPDGGNPHVRFRRGLGLSDRPGLLNSGTRMILAVALLAACGTQTNVGSRYVKTIALTASVGGTLSVNASESAELNGLSLAFPAGALATDRTITLELGLDDVALAPNVPRGPVAIFGPELTFLKDVELRLPSSASYQGSSAETEVLLKTPAGLQRIRAPQLTHDPVAHAVTMIVHSTGALQVTVHSCPGAGSCGAGETCTSGSCVNCPIDPTLGATCACDATTCGPRPASPTCLCSDGSVGCNTGRCISTATNACHWEFRTCP